MELQKLEINIIDINVPKVVMFNPTTMQFFKELSWVDSGSRATELRQKQYDIIKYQKLKMELFFDFTMLNNESFKEYFEFFEFITSEKIIMKGREDETGDENRGGGDLVGVKTTRYIARNLRTKIEASDARARRLAPRDIADFIVERNKVKIKEAEILYREASADRNSLLKRPPLLKLTWGTEELFTSCVVTKIDWSFEMFDRAGNILRAIADITFEEIDREGAKTEADKSKRGTFLGRIKKI